MIIYKNSLNAMKLHSLAFLVVLNIYRVYIYVHRDLFLYQKILKTSIKLFKIKKKMYCEYLNIIFKDRGYIAENISVKQEPYH